MSQIEQLILNIEKRLKDTARRIPIVRDIPAFNSMPSAITHTHLRYYKLSNLALTLGMLTHLSWILLFTIVGAMQMAYINIASVLIYIYSIFMNRKGNHFASSIIMVFEILLHQYFAIQYFGWVAGFQNYVLVIGLFPFLMPRGRWGIKFFLLGSCIFSYILYDYYLSSGSPHFQSSIWFGNYLRISNLIFSFASLAVCGGYFNNAMHETEDILEERTEELIVEKEKSDNLLLNILPIEIAHELKQNNGIANPQSYEQVSVLFTDFINFTQACEQMSATELVREIDYYYSRFDEIISHYRIEKIKTIGDSYMCVGGLPVPNVSHPTDILHAALAIRDFIYEERCIREQAGRPYFNVRIGVHTGPVVAGIVGTKKFAYDIWGDTVNIASRMESSSEAGSINISATSYQLVKDTFDCTYRGKLAIKNKGEMDMYTVESPR